MTEITIKVHPALYRRLRHRATQAGTNVPALVGDLVGAAALLLSDPDLTTPPRTVLRRIASALDDGLTPEEIADRHLYRLDTVNNGIRELERINQLVQTYEQR